MNFLLDPNLAIKTGKTWIWIPTIIKIKKRTRFRIQRRIEPGSEFKEEQNPVPNSKSFRYATMGEEPDMGPIRRTILSGCGQDVKKNQLSRRLRRRKANRMQLTRLRSKQCSFSSRCFFRRCLEVIRNTHTYTLYNNTQARNTGADVTPEPKRNRISVYQCCAANALFGNSL